jgi:hypothetical protein
MLDERKSPLREKEIRPNPSSADDKQVPRFIPGIFAECSEQTDLPKKETFERTWEAETYCKLRLSWAFAPAAVTYDAGPVAG